MKIAVIDNYDSFVYNITHYLESFDGVQTWLMKNDCIDWNLLDQVDRILLSPGPGIPSEAGSLMQVIEKYYTRKPILGVCLGHQALGVYFGATLKNLDVPLHGKISQLYKITEDKLWDTIQFPTQIGHYHSWVIDHHNFSSQLEILAVDEWQNIMSFRHKKWPIKGIQFHPESVLTPSGKQMLFNWIND